MNTKNLINALRECKKPYMIMHYFSAKMIADYLEELEKQLDEQKEINKQFANCCIDPKEGQQPEWISVEDRLPGKELVICTDGKYCFMNCIHDMDDVTEDGVTHWMPLPEPPKPKESTFKDVFLGSFPKANIDMITHIICVRSIFPHTKPNMIDCAKYDCEKCWNQPYFEEE